MKSRVITRLFYAGNNFEESSNSKPNVSPNVSVTSHNATEKDIEEEKDIDIKEEKDIDIKEKGL